MKAPHMETVRNRRWFQIDGVRQAPMNQVDTGWLLRLQLQSWGGNGSLHTPSTAATYRGLPSTGERWGKARKPRWILRGDCIVKLHWRLGDLNTGLTTHREDTPSISPEVS